MQFNKYLRIITAFFAAPWAIMPEKLDAMSSFLRFAATGGKYSADDVAEKIGPKAAMSAAATNQPTTIAVIPVHGIIDQKAARVDDISGPGGTSTERTARLFRAAMNDDTVKAVVFDIDSPGGTVYGVAELANEIYKARGRKPIVSIANSLSASAAEWIASQSDESVITPGGEKGSIGVYAMHTDISKWLENDGTKVTLISAGEFKVEGNPYEPLSDEASAYIQSRINEYYSMFTKAVARGRGVPVAKVKSDFGKGRVFGAEDAVRSGMADRVATFEETIDRLARSKKSMVAMSGQDGGYLAEVEPEDAEEVTANNRITGAAEQIAASPAVNSMEMAKRQQELLEAGQA
jgi:signal peptide peptidase SppA